MCKDEKFEEGEKMTENNNDFFILSLLVAAWVLFGFCYWLGLLFFAIVFVWLVIEPLKRLIKKRKKEKTNIEKEIKSAIRKLKLWLKWAVVNKYWAEATIYQAQIDILEEILKKKNEKAKK